MVPNEPPQMREFVDGLQDLPWLPIDDEPEAAAEEEEIPTVDIDGSP